MFGEHDSEGGAPFSFRRQAWEEWTDPSIIAAWIKWKAKSDVLHSDLTRSLLERTGLFVGAEVLDLASGTGEPALTIASRIGPAGSVVATEISSEFISAIQTDAAKRGLANLTVVQADACNLPFPDATFDVATSRLGAMYFVPTTDAFAEIRRVLRPGGRIALLTWGMPEQSTYYKSCVFPFLMRSNVDPPPPEAPTPLRFSPPGSLAEALSEAGFDDVAEARELLPMRWPGEPLEFWEHVYDVAAPLRFIFDSLSRSDFREAYEEALTLLHELWDGSGITMTSEVVVGSGSR